MNEDCVFCGIVVGTEPSSVVYEDDLMLAVLDLRQFNPGHVLVIPRVHVVDIREADGTTASALGPVIARVARALTHVFRPDGISVWHSIGEAAGQEVPHAHFHIQPRTIGDGMLRVYPSRPAYPAREDLDVMASRIRERMAAG